MARADDPMITGTELDEVVRATTLDNAAGPHDAIVIGTGAAGGLAALLLAEAGLRVLALETGGRRPARRSALRRLSSALVRELAHPRSLRVLPPAVIPKARAVLKLVGRWRQPIQALCYARPGGIR
jgi:glycine/D-amino acid oxidase-like deaminating enzyme